MTGSRLLKRHIHRYVPDVCKYLLSLFSTLLFLARAYTVYQLLTTCIFSLPWKKNQIRANLRRFDFPTIDKRRDIDINSAMLEIDRLTVVSTVIVVRHNHLSSVLTSLSLCSVYVYLCLCVRVEFIFRVIIRVTTVYVRIRSSYRDAEIPLALSSLSVYTSLYPILPLPLPIRTFLNIPTRGARDHLLPLPRFFLSRSPYIPPFLLYLYFRPQG